VTKSLRKVKYTCLHPSCQVYCKKGELTFDSEAFSELYAECDDPSEFKSPPDYCRLGFAQPFKVVSMEDVVASHGERDAGPEVVPDSGGTITNPMAILKLEHKGVLEKLATIEDQIKKRDLDGLWATTAAIENDIVLHSVMKEEQALFPAIAKTMPMAPSLINIMHEDHKEFLSLLHALRAALQDDEILNGIATTIVVNLKSHIRKEDLEFFQMIDEHLDDTTRKALLDQFAAIESSYVPLELGVRTGSKISSYTELRRKIDEEVDAMRHNLVNQDSSCCEHA